MKIGFTGAQGTGKTTAAKNLLQEMRSKAGERFIKIDLVHEAARSCPLPINKETNCWSQLWIAAEMFQREIEQEIVEKNDIIICDRTLLDAFAYSIRADPNFFRTLEPFIESYMGTYDVIFYMPIHKGWLKKDGVRDVDPKFQKDINDRIYSYLNKWNLMYHTMPTLDEQIEYLLSEEFATGC